MRSNGARRTLALAGLAGALAAGAVAAQASTAATPTKIFDNNNIYAVQSGASGRTIFRTSKPWRIMEIWTYHWNGAEGARPGKIGLRDMTTGKAYGPWTASGRPGQGGVPNAYWVVFPRIDLPAGRYQVIDSDPSTWAQNEQTDGRGIAWVIALPGFEWPPLPDGLVAIEVLANGCGPGKASSEERWGDTSTYKDSTGTYVVNFRAACNLHDAGYSGAKVRDTINGGTVDYLSWTRKRVDDKFLADMRKLCDEQIPSEAVNARAQCKGRGGALSFGAWSRYNAVDLVGGLAWLERPQLRDTWLDDGDSGTQVLALLQTGRSVSGAWRGTASDPAARGEFRGTLVCMGRAKGFVVKGWAKVTSGSGAVSLEQMTIRIETGKLDRIVVTGGRISGPRSRA